MRKSQLIPFFCAIAMGATACSTSDNGADQSISPAAGHRTYPTRIVSLSATATQMLFAIGAGPQVVAVDRYSPYPRSAPRTNLSGFQPNVEAIARYRPDLVINDADVGHLSQSLRALHIPVLIEPAAKTFAASYRQMTDLGTATGHTADAQATVNSMRARIARIVAAVPRPRAPLRVYHELDPTYYSATSATFIGQVYRLFGLRNVADKAGITKNSGYPQLSAEYVVAANPQVIVLADTTCCHQSARTLASRPGWAHIDAVRHSLVLGVDDGLASEWGPQIVQFVSRVAHLLRRAESVYR